MTEAAAEESATRVVVRDLGVTEYAEIFAAMKAFTEQRK